MPKPWTHDAQLHLGHRLRRDDSVPRLRPAGRWFFCKEMAGAACESCLALGVGTKTSKKQLAMCYGGCHNMLSWTSVNNPCPKHGVWNPNATNPRASDRLPCHCQVSIGCRLPGPSHSCLVAPKRSLQCSKASKVKCSSSTKHTSSTFYLSSVSVWLWLWLANVWFGVSLKKRDPWFFAFGPK